MFHRSIHSGQELEIELRTTGCRGQSNEVNFLEHVQIELDMEYSKRGDLAINLTSAMGEYMRIFKHTNVAQYG